MKRLLTVLMVFIMMFSVCLNVLSEGGQPPEIPDGFGPSEGGPTGTPFPAGMTPPEGFDGFEPSDDGPGGMTFPEGITPPEGGFGGMPFGDFRGQQGHAEGQLGSWSMGGKDAASVEGDDYAYDAALHVTAEGVNAEKSAAERITSGA